MLFTNLISHSNPIGCEYRLYLYFIDEEAEVRRGRGTHPEGVHQSGRRAGLLLQYLIKSSLWAVEAQILGFAITLPFLSLCPHLLNRILTIFPAPGAV